MALSNGRAGFNSGPMIFLSPRTKDAEGHAAKPHFTVDRKNDAGEFVRDPETVTEVTGDLFRIEVKRREYNGDPKVDVVLYLRDGDEAYRLPVTLNMPGRDLINRLASLTEGGDFTGLTVSYYENKKGYDAFGLEQGGNRVQWKHERNALPEPFAITDPRNPEKIIKRDFADLNAVFEQEAEAIADALGQKKPAASASAGDDAAQQEQAAAEQAAAEPEATPEPQPAPAPKPIARATPVPKNTLPPPAAKPAAAATSTPRPAPRANPAPAARPAPAPAKAAATPARPPAPAVARSAPRPAARPAPAPAPQPDPVATGGENLDEDVPF